MRTVDLDILEDEAAEEQYGEIVLSGLVSPPQVHSIQRGVFVIDTGSPASILGHELVDLLDIPVSPLSFDIPGHMAGEKLEFAPLPDVEFSFLTGENRFEGTLDFEIPRYFREGGPPIDSVLGLDFLDLFDLRLEVDYKGRHRAFLHIPEDHIQ
ncbi:MAG: retropepsin-like aspartic protease [Candidatus Nanohaloarchaea archaeon]|nr:retropepsin-like aspartic protease [Candidatus Nanohaloarchaea archaeon]